MIHRWSKRNKSHLIICGNGESASSKTPVLTIPKSVLSYITKNTGIICDEKC